MARKFANQPTPSKAPGETFDFSSCTAIRAEDADAIAQINARLVAFYQPANSEELFAIQRIALARHSLLRTYRIESGLVTFGLQKALQIPGEPQILGDPEETGEPPVTTGRPPATAGQEDSFWMGTGFCYANSQSHWQFFLRYQAQAERLHRRAMEEFERLRRQRGLVPEQPVVEPEPAAERPPTPEPQTPPTPQSQCVDPLGVPAPTQPAAVPPRRPRRVSHRRRPTRPSRVVLRTAVPPASRQSRPNGIPKCPMIALNDCSRDSIRPYRTPPPSPACYYSVLILERIHVKVYESKDIRNVGVVGHGDSGKTTLTAGLLFTAGATNRLLRVDEGNTITDFDEEEIQRKITISTAIAVAEWKKTKINLLDTPGYNIFINDTRAALVAADAALVLVDGVAGVEVQTEKVWSFADDFKLPRAIVINKLDRERADFERALESVQENFGRTAVPIQIPIGAERDFKGVVDLIRMKAYTYTPDGDGKGKEGDIPADLADAAQKAHEALVEMVAEGNDALMEEFFDKGTLPVEHIVDGLQAGASARCASSRCCAPPACTTSAAI